jgi:dTDP-4-amino-4,6-dideoxygalactose transaminase
MPQIVTIAKNHNLVIIEDAAHSPGAKYDGKSLGKWGDIACFSFFSNNNLSAGDGGMIVTDKADIADMVRIMRSHGMTSLTWDRHKGHAYSYDVVDLGYNYRIDEIRSALGQVQLGKLQRNNNRRREITNKYKQLLANTPIDIPFQNHEGESAYHIFPILLPQDIDRKSFINSMRSSRIQASIHYPPIHHFQYYQARYPDTSFPVTKSIAEREVTLPLYPNMTEGMVETVVSAVKVALEKS